MKSNEQARGTPLSAVAMKVTDGFFFVGLSNVDAERARNKQLLKEQSWLGVPLVYANQRSAILAIEKGVPGERAFNEAFAAWGEDYPTAPTVQPEPATPKDGGYLAQVSSHKNEADALSSYRALQNKFPNVLGSRSPMIKHVDLGDKGVYYRAMVGPFGTTEAATQFCADLKTVGGQCIVQRN